MHKILCKAKVYIPSHCFINLGSKGTEDLIYNEVKLIKETKHLPKLQVLH